MTPTYGTVDSVCILLYYKLVHQRDTRVGRDVFRCNRRLSRHCAYPLGDVLEEEGKGQCRHSDRDLRTAHQPERTTDGAGQSHPEQAAGRRVLHERCRPGASHRFTCTAALQEDAEQVYVHSGTCRDAQRAARRRHPGAQCSVLQRVVRRSRPVDWQQDQ